MRLGLNPQRVFSSYAQKGKMRERGYTVPIPVDFGSAFDLHT